MGQPRPHPKCQGPASMVEFKDFLDSTKEGVRGMEVPQWGPGRSPDRG